MSAPTEICRSHSSYRRSARRFAWTALLSFSVLACSLAATVTVASAAVTHEFLPEPSKKLSEGVPAKGPHGEAVPVPGPFQQIKSLTVDSGKLYVAEQVKVNNETGYSRIDNFDDSSGSFVAQFPQVVSPSYLSNGNGYLHQGIVVGHSTSEAQMYVGGDDESTNVHQGVLAVLDSAGSVLGVWRGADTPAKAFGCFECNDSGASIAVDESTSIGDWASGDVYVADRQNGAVDVFKPEAGGGEKYVTQLTGPEPPGVLFAQEPTYVAVDQATGEVFVVDGGSAGTPSAVDVFRPAAIAGQYEFLGKLTGPPGGFSAEVTGMTVDGGNGDIYVTQSGQSIDEFNAAKEYVGMLTGTPTGPSDEFRSFRSITTVAVDPATHHVFVADDNESNEQLIEVFGQDTVIPDVTTGGSSNATPFGATLNGTVNPDKAGEASCRFVWGTTKELGQVAPCEPEAVAEGGSAVNVHAALSKLQPDTTYYYRLQATNKNGTNAGEPGQDQEFTTPGPGLHGETVSSVSSTSATLEGTINPHNFSTSYYFEYGLTTEYGSQSPTAPGISIGSGEGDVEVARRLQGLQQATTYHYRIVAVSDLGGGEPETFPGPDQTFTTQPPGAPLTLPDGRAWELVSPVNKHGALLEPIGETGVPQAAVSGRSITYLADVPTEENPKGYGEGSVEPSVQILSTRGAAGWSSEDIQLAHATATGIGTASGMPYRAFSEDLSTGLVEAQGGGEFNSLGPESVPPDTARTPYLRHDNTCATVSNGCYEPLLTEAPEYADVLEGGKFGQGSGAAKFEGASPDLAHVVISSPFQLTTASAPHGGLYEWSAALPPTERLQLVSVLPRAAGEAPGENASLGQPSTGRSVVDGAVSEDGTRVVWTEGSQHHLYVRDASKKETVQLDEVQGGSGEGGAAPQYQGASRDGSKIFFTDTQRLTADSRAGSAGPDLYECEIVDLPGGLHCLLTDITASNSEPADVVGEVMGVSEDGTWVYYAANGALATHATRGSCTGGNGGLTCNLYVSHFDGANWDAPRLIAEISGNDVQDGGPRALAARVSPDGLKFAFMSQQSLTGYDNRDAVSGQRDEEVYLYDATGSGGAGTLVCASCDPTGARPHGVEYQKLGALAGGDAVWRPSQWVAANIPGWVAYNGSAALHQPRYLSDAGRLFFNSSDALAPQDINGNEDVYQFEPTGVGDCSTGVPTYSSRSDGCVALISSGTSAYESAFLDASEDGSDVFFLTTEPLVSQDIDTALDLYDARICTEAEPCATSTVVSPECTTADSCRAAPTPQPASFGAPASATFTGAGNVTPTPSAPATKAKTLTRAQKLAKALKACRKKPKQKRVLCERHARSALGAKKSSTANVRSTGGKSR